MRKQEGEVKALLVVGEEVFVAGMAEAVDVATAEEEVGDGDAEDAAEEEEGDGDVEGEL